jgi:hypothetical protein
MAKSFRYRKIGEQGSVAWLITTWLPLFLTLTISLSVLSFAMVVRVKANKICFEGMVRLQRGLRATLIELSKLNKQAASLRAKRTAAEIQLKAAIASATPPFIAEAQAVRMLVMSAQLALKAKQQELLQKARRQRLEARRNVARDLHSLGGRLQSDDPSLFLSLAVRPSPPADLTPDYLPLPQFRRFQAERIHYQVPLFKGVPPWLLKNLTLPATQESECGATLNEGDWSLALSLDKVPGNL